MMSADNKGSLYAILSGFLYGFIGYFGINAINGNISASNMIFWRFLIASLLILLLVIPQLKRTTDSFKEIRAAFFSGVLFYGLSTLIYFYSSLYIGSGLAMVIFFTYPVIVLLLNYFLYGQRIPPVYYFATGIILVGMVMLTNLDQMAFNLWGILLAVISAFFYACYMVASKNNKVSPTMSTLMVSLGCMVPSFAATMATNTFVVPNTLSLWINLFGIAVVATVVPILLLLHSLKYISSEKASILSVLEPVFVVIFGVILLHEELRIINAVGIILILSGALLTLFSHRINLAYFKTPIASQT